MDGSPCDKSIGFEERAGMTNQLRYQRRRGTIVGRVVEKTHDTTTTVSLTSLECSITDGKQFRPYAMIRVKATTTTTTTTTTTIYRRSSI